MLMSEILMPFLAAFIFAYILEPLKVRLAMAKIPEGLAALVAVFIGIIAATFIILLLLNLLQHEIPQIRQQFPQWIENLKLWLTPKLATFDIELDWKDIQDQATAQITTQLSDNANTVVTKSITTILKSSSSILGFFANSVLALFVLFYLLLDWNHFFGKIGNAIPKKLQATIFPLAIEVDSLLSQYLRGQVLVMLVLSVTYSLGLYLIGVKSAFALGTFTGLVAFIPYVGFMISLCLSLLAALLQFGSGNEILLVLVLFSLGQVLEGFYLTPRLVGERIGLHPVAVLFALMVFGKLFGFLGILLAFPMSAICLVAFRFLKHKYFSSQWYKAN
ncbi:Predicted PurR-regulated permease PerM [Polynucleobacter kasalickyi]|uniref:Predicted PurR-regulated permease PerM n=2 Tax=Polynucleobacter kasalickyi TaxID=1938817 RepID=A0A1W1YHN2_9BURK|nr:Predicted PurR-regulated permease PerM [Polynucleobacter kasalickyi]